MTTLIPTSLNQPIESHISNEHLTAHNCDDGQTWFLVHCKPNAEKLALRNLKNQGFTVFLPLYKMTRRRGATFQTLIMPLFPGYIFVAENPVAGQWHKINNTRGVARIVRFAEKPTPVPPTVMHQLFARCDEKSLFEHTASLDVGDDVKITKGSLTGSIAKIIKIEPNQRVHLLFHFMGQDSMLEVDAAGVAPTD